jgi:NAD(P)-dependent dehydrogenase (short-subunit alcohol dehydrogenase family)
MSGPGIALVTGGGTGIGRAVALTLGARGHHVIVIGRRAAPLDETAELIRAAGGAARSHPLDVTDTEGLDRLLSGLGDQRLDVAVANAGSFVRGPVADLNVADWRQQVDVNLTGAFLTLRSAVRQMIRQSLVDGRRGHLFTVNSGAGVVGFPTGSAYAAAKHGLRGLVESLRPEVAPLGIKVTDLVISATVESDLTAGRDVPKIQAATVGHTITSCLDLPGTANWDRVDLGQVHH